MTPRFQSGAGWSSKIGLFLLLPVFALVLVHTNWLYRWDLLLYDWTLATWSRAPADDIVIVAIDEQSLRELGRWPWSRRTHAELVRKLSAAGAKAIALDIVFAEPDATDPAADAELAVALADHGRVVLPVLNEQNRLGGQLLETLPIPVLAAAVAGMGHIDVELDQDGIARSVYLKAGLGSPYWPTLALALLELESASPTARQALPGQRAAASNPSSPYVWRRDYRVLIPFAGPPGHFRHFSYREVLRDGIAPATFRDKLVLVGLTATGMGDALPTPVSGQAQPMSGVEFNANVLDALRQGLTIRPLAPGWALLLTGMLALFPLALYAVCPPRWTLPLAGLALLLTLTGSFILLHGAHRWFPPAAALLVQGLSYPLWSWQRLHHVMHSLFEQEERAQVTLHSIGDAVITTDGHAVVDYLNLVAEALTGWTTAEAQGRPLSEVFRIVDEQTRQPAPDPVARCLQEGKSGDLANPTVLIGRNGREYDIDVTAAPIRGRDGQVLGAVLVFHNVTENRQLARQLEYDATHDALTGLVNRAEFERRLERALTSAQQYGARHALCYLDLDQFKVVNDTAGHAAGDELLRQINTLLSGMFRERDTLARIGGDEFGLLLENCPLERAQLIAQTVASHIHEHRFHWESRTYQIGVSIGLAPITAETQDTAQLLTQADVACYIAKELGRNRVHLYQREDSETAQRHGEILGAAGLRDALEQGRFRLHYQPIIPLRALEPRPVCYEVLLRVAYKSSPDETSELVLPAAFIPAAERYGLMGAIDRWVIQTAFRDYANGIGRTGARIAINLSGNSLSDETLLAFIEAQFAEHAFPPERVCFEITETAAIQNLRHALDLMAALKRRSSQFALDDFGSGLSSFHYLKSLPVDYLKIDGSFVKDMIDNARDDALVAAINQMSHTLDLQTVAEYVHCPAIVARLRELGVDYAQGYFFGRPAPWGEPSREREQRVAE